jgi:hypothetical protein
MRTLKIALCLLGPVFGAASARAVEPSGAYAVVEGPQGVVKAPLFSEKYEKLAVARIDGEVVTLRDLTELLGATHAAHAGAAAPGATRDFTPALNRLIGARLIGLEARDMGLDEQAEFKLEMATYAESHLIQMLKDRATAAARPDPRDVERLFRDAVREWKVQSVLFPKEDDAKGFSAALAKGRKFDKLAAEAISAGKAQGTQKADWVSRKTAIAQVVQNLAALNKVGASTRPMRLSSGWAVARIEKMRYPEDAKAREEARREALGFAKKRALKKYYDRLLDKSVRVEQELAARLDFEAKEPGFAALEKDERILARIEGAQPIAVKDLAANLRTIFFHGIDRAIEEKKVNAKKFPALDSLISRRLLPVEARRQHLDTSVEHERAVAEQRQSLLFGAYVEKAIAPDLKVTDAEAQKYYQQHKSEYTFSTFYTVSTLGFRSAAAAQSALDKLKAGADFKWVKANAEHQLPPGTESVNLDGTVSETTIAKDLAAALSGARAGDLRIYSPSKDESYLLVVKQVTPARPQAFEEVRADILPLVQKEKLNKAIEDIIERLRKARTVQVYIKQIAT